MAQSGANTCAAFPTSTPVNPGSATPTMVNGCPSSDTLRPTAPAAPPYSLCQKPWPSTATAGQPRKSSAAPSSRPAAGATPRVPK
jgi:hypothetical protein